MVRCVITSDDRAESHHSWDCATSPRGHDSPACHPDRVGGGDSFASGLIYGFLKHNDAQLAVEFGAAHGALAMTTPGDTTMATLSEVEKLVEGGSARVDR